jgi:CBS domain-containing protein
VWAASVGQVAAVVLILLGLVHDFWLGVAGVLILPAANAELRYALAVRQIVDRRTGDVARSEIIVINDTTTLSDAADRSVSAPLADFLVVNDDHRRVGFLSAPRLWAVLRSDEPGTQSVASFARPLSNPISSRAPLDAAICSFADGDPETAPVIDDQGGLIGIVTKADLVRASELARRATGR